jgi:DNA-binding transcriptional MerR regulator
MKIKAVCEATGLTDRTIRYYVEEKLISPAYTENYLGRKTFDFSESIVKQLNDIAVLRKFGFSIAEIREMLLHPEGIPQIVNELQERKHAHINEETELLRALSQLNTSRSYTVAALADSLSEPVANTPLPAEDTSWLNIFLSGCGKYTLFRLGSIVAGCIFICLWILICALIPADYVETTDIADYGHYPNVKTTDIEHILIHSFFPESLKDSFSDIRFSYKAENIDNYGFEAYLEFRIENPLEFDQYIDSIAEEQQWKDFAFDSNFKEFSIKNELCLDVDDPYDPKSLFQHQIIQADIRKVLYSLESQTIIYVAIGVHDGGGVGTNYLNVFFSRFGIDPVEYGQTTDSPYMKGSYDIS